MKSITFGYLLDKLLYLSRQKKTALAKTLGYDISYISKWTSGKNLPIPKNINSICEMTSKFIVNSTSQEDIKNIKEYFEIDENLNSKKELEVYLEELLRESYAYTAKKSVSIKTKEEIISILSKYCIRENGVSNEVQSIDIFTTLGSN